MLKGRTTRTAAFAVVLFSVFCMVGEGWAEDIGEAGGVEIEGVHRLGTGTEQGGGGTGKTKNPDAWTATDTALQVVYTTLHTMDWAQTLKIARNPARYWEENPILGAYPSEGKINSYFAATLVLHTGAAYLLPKRARIFGMDVPARTVWQSVWIVLESETVNHNRRHGLGISFHF